MGKITIVDDTGQYTQKRDLTISEMSSMSKEELSKHGYMRFDSPEEFMKFKEEEWASKPPKPLTADQELKWYSFIRIMEEIVDEFRNR